MNDVKLMTPLFRDGRFNRGGRRMKAVFLKEISDGTGTFRLWRSAGKPDVSYPRAEDDKYLLHVEINGYLAPLGMTEFALADACGYLPAIEGLYGGREQRREYFRSLGKARLTDPDAFDAASEREAAEIRRIGGDPARQAAHIRKMLDAHVNMYLTAKEDDGRSFPDFVGALMLNELPVCADLSARHRELRSRDEEERLAKKRRTDEELVRNGNAEAEQAIRTALETIRRGGTLENVRVKLFTLTPDGYAVSEYSIVNHLMRQFGIDVPLRTQGWINDRLTKTEIKDGRCTYLTFLRKRRGRGSQKFFDCMRDLIRAVRETEETNADTREQGLTETGLQKLRDAADPDLPHSYDWYVMEDYNTPEEQFTSGLSLEDAIQKYAASERSGKRLGVTKDGIAAVDLLIRHDGREWISDDWTKSESFSEDPVAAEAVSAVRLMLDGQADG